MHVFVLVYLEAGKNALGNQKRVLDTLELELQMVECYPTWVLTGFESCPLKEQEMLGFCFLFVHFLLLLFQDRVSHCN